MTDDDADRCQWCGADGYFEWELKDGKCQTCIVQDCHHSNTTTDYTGPTWGNDPRAHRARFIEHCIDCESWREYRFYFTGEQARVIGPWRSDE